MSKNIHEKFIRRLAAATISAKGLVEFELHKDYGKLHKRVKK